MSTCEGAAAAAGDDSREPLHESCAPSAAAMQLTLTLVRRCCPGSTTPRRNELSSLRLFCTCLHMCPRTAIGITLAGAIITALVTETSKLTYRSETVQSNNTHNKLQKSSKNHNNRFEDLLIFWRRSVPSGGKRRPIISLSAFTGRYTRYCGVIVGPTSKGKQMHHHQ
eukprot:scpid90862/ scgid22220/ 